MKKVMIIGAASAIVRHTAIEFAKEGAMLFLSDINLGRLESVADDIRSRHSTQIAVAPMDVTDFDKHKELIENAVNIMGGLDVIVIAHGTLPDQKELEANPAKIIREFNINCLSVISLASIAANYLEEQKKGTIAVISSVAGDRGRQSNYIYGSAKGGVTVFLQGLRNRLSKSGVNVLTIKPGMVDTPMTAHLPKNFLFAKAEAVGLGIYNAIQSGKDVVYLPGYWRCVMHVVRHIPESIFKKLSL